MRILDFSDGFSSNTQPTATSADIANVPSGNVTSTNMQAAINELQTHIDTNSTAIATNATAIGSPTAAATASTIAKRDANANIIYNNVTESFTSTVTSASPITMTPSSTGIQQFTGSTAQSVTLPATNASGMSLGFQFQLFNRSSAVVTVKDSSGSTIQAMAAGSQLIVTAATSASPGTWDITYTLSANSALPISAGGTGQTAKAAAFDALHPMTTGGDLIYGGASGAATRLANGSLGQVLTSGGGTAAPTWSPALSNPMTTPGDVIIGGTSGAATRLAVGADGSYLGSDSSATNGLSWQNPANGYNFLLNGAFDYWQAGTTTTITDTGGASPATVTAYQADQWYVSNALGAGTTEGVITYSQVAGVTDGSKYGASVKITTAPVGTGIASNFGIYQPLSNLASLNLYNKTASFSIRVKALGNVNSVGLAFMYSTGEVKLANVISFSTCSVNSGAFTLCTLNGVALGTSQTTSGIIGVRVNVLAVSSGNIYDLNNGFVVEQGMVNIGSVALPFQRHFRDPTQELAACQYFYEVLNTEASATKDFALGWNQSANTTGQFVIPFKVVKRAAPTTTVSNFAHFNVTDAATSAAATSFTSLRTNIDTSVLNFGLSGTYAAGSANRLSSNSTSARIYFDSRI